VTILCFISFISISNFLFALKSPESKRQYPRRFKVFFDFDRDKSLPLEEQANLFKKKAVRQGLLIMVFNGQLINRFYGINP
jgi:hypothetical protein